MVHIKFCTILFLYHFQKLFDCWKSGVTLTVYLTRKTGVVCFKILCLGNFLFRYIFQLNRHKKKIFHVIISKCKEKTSLTSHTDNLFGNSQSSVNFHWSLNADWPLFEVLVQYVTSWEKSTSFIMYYPFS